MVNAPDSTVSRRSWTAIIVLLAGLFMGLLDTTIVNVALPAIRTALDTSEGTLAWIVSGYALAFGLVLIPAGRAADRYGPKWIFFIGLLIFTGASLTCGLAQDQVGLVVSRVVQGAGAGMFFPAVLTYIQLLFPPSARGKALGSMAAVIGVSTALGPIIGGLLIQAFGDDVGWRAVFGVNIPIGIVTLIAAVFLLPKEPGRAMTGIDIGGLLFLSAGLVAILFPLIEGQSLDWPVWTFVSLGVGILFLVVFALWEVRYTNRGKVALVPPRLFTSFAFTGGTILALVYFAAFTSIFFVISIFWQAGLGNTALDAGLVSLPFALGSVLGASQSARLTTRFGRNVLVVGLACVTLGLTWVWAIIAFTSPLQLVIWPLIIPFFIAGIGNGLFIAPNVGFVVATVERADAGAAGGVIGAVQRIGSAIGVAIIGSILFGTLKITGAGRAAVAAAYAQSTAIAMLVTVALCAAALVLVFVLPKKAKEGPTPVDAGG